MSADDLTMPDDVAKRAATELRTIAAGMLGAGVGLNQAARLTALADTIDPPPLSLREQVAGLLDGDDDYSFTDALLNLVADALAAQPLTADKAACAEQRDADVAFIHPGGAT